MSNDIGLGVFYWPQMDMLLVESFDDCPGLYEAPNVTQPKDKRKWLWTDIGDCDNELVRIGEL